MRVKRSEWRIGAAQTLLGLPRSSDALACNLARCAHMPLQRKVLEVKFAPARFWTRTTRIDRHHRCPASALTACWLILVMAKKRAQQPPTPFPGLPVRLPASNRTGACRGRLPPFLHPTALLGSCRRDLHKECLSWVSSSILRRVHVPGKLGGRKPLGNGAKPGRNHETTTLPQPGAYRSYLARLRSSRNRRPLPWHFAVTGGLDYASLHESQL